MVGNSWISHGILLSGGSLAKSTRNTGIFESCEGPSGCLGLPKKLSNARIVCEVNVLRVTGCC